MKQAEATAALESFWDDWWPNNRGSLRAAESTADLECVSAFLEKYPAYENFRARIGARHRLELWADKLRRDAIMSENARLGLL